MECVLISGIDLQNFHIHSIQINTQSLGLYLSDGVFPERDWGSGLNSQLLTTFQTKQNRIQTHFSVWT